MSSPIADLSYRHYDGPLQDVSKRWWAIAKYQSMKAIKNRWVWVLGVLSGWYYMVMMVVVFIVEQMAQSTGGAQGEQMMGAFFKRIIWKDQFLLGFSFGQMIFLWITLIIGAGTIANDNRANALLVYLSKPCTKLDYVFGKWLGIFLPLAVIQLVPVLVFWLYGAASWNSYGFLKDDPLVLLKMIGVIAMSASVHASLVLGVSSLFNQGRVAGSVYLGLYMMSNLFTQAIVIAFMSQMGGRGGRGTVRSIANVDPILTNYYYWSIDGIQIGIAKVFLQTSGSPPFNIDSGIPSMAIPKAIAIFAGWVIVCGAGILLAWRRVRAVEVVG